MLAALENSATEEEKAQERLPPPASPAHELPSGASPRQAEGGANVSPFVGPSLDSPARARERAAPASSSEGHSCQHCGEPIPRRKNQSRTVWLGKRYCSKACANKANPDKRLGGRCCLACGARLVKREGEAPSNFENRKTCDWECARAYRKSDAYRALMSSKYGQVWGTERKPRVLADWPRGIRFADDPAAINDYGSPSMRRPDRISACSSSASWAAIGGEG